MKKNLDYYGLSKPNSNWSKLFLTMKISGFLLFCCLVNIYAAPTYSQATKISLNLKDATIEEVLNKIEDVSEFYFLFNQKLIDVNQKVNIEADKEPIKDTLGHVYEYFLGQFALAEGKKGGQFYTPRSVVKLLVEMLENQ